MDAGERGIWREGGVGREGGGKEWKKRGTGREGGKEPLGGLDIGGVFCSVDTSACRGKNIFALSTTSCKDLIPQGAMEQGACY